MFWLLDCWCSAMYWFRYYQCRYHRNGLALCYSLPMDVWDHLLMTELFRSTLNEANMLLFICFVVYSHFKSFTVVLQNISDKNKLLLAVQIVDVLELKYKSWYPFPAYIYRCFNFSLTDTFEFYSLQYSMPLTLQHFVWGVGRCLQCFWTLEESLKWLLQQQHHV